MLKNANHFTIYSLLLPMFLLAFSKGSVTVNEAHNIGVKFQEEMWPLTFTTVMVTHSNKENIHNHMIIIPIGNESFNEKKFYKKREEITKNVWKEIKG